MSHPLSHLHMICKKIGHIFWKVLRWLFPDLGQAKREWNQRCYFISSDLTTSRNLAHQATYWLCRSMACYWDTSPECSSPCFPWSTASISSGPWRRCQERALWRCRPQWPSVRRPSTRAKEEELTFENCFYMLLEHLIPSKEPQHPCSALHERSPETGPRGSRWLRGRGGGSRPLARRMRLWHWPVMDEE